MIRGLAAHHNDKSDRPLAGNIVIRLFIHTALMSVLINSVFIHVRFFTLLLCVVDGHRFRFMIDMNICSNDYYMSGVLVSLATLLIDD